MDFRHPSPHLRIALTGGIGSGKSFVAQRLRARGIEVFDCDASAKRLLRSSEPLMERLRQLVGDHLYADGRLQKQVLAAYLLASDENKQRINALVHPAVHAISNNRATNGSKVPSSLKAVSMQG